MFAHQTFFEDPCNRVYIRYNGKTERNRWVFLIFRMVAHLCNGQTSMAVRSFKPLTWTGFWVYPFGRWSMMKKQYGPNKIIEDTIKAPMYLIDLDEAVRSKLWIVSVREGSSLPEGLHHIMAPENREESYINMTAETLGLVSLFHLKYVLRALNFLYTKEIAITGRYEPCPKTVTFWEPLNR